MNPLYLLSNKPKRNWSWQIEHQEAFDKIKQALATATMLNHPDPNATLGLTTDSSDFAVGGVLEQFNGRCWEPLAFFSKKLKQAETRYSTFDRELLAVVLAIKHFRHMVEARNLIIFTDHKPLESVMSTANPSDCETTETYLFCFRVFYRYQTHKREG